MLDRIIFCVCHPSKIVYFFKDKIYKPILYVLSFFLLYVGICALSTYSTQIFTYSYKEEAVNTAVRYISSMVTTNVEFNKDTKEFSGNEAKFIGPIFEIVFMNSGNLSVSNSSLVLLSFEKDNAKSYYRGICIGEFNYNDLANPNSFSLKDVVSGNTLDRDNLYGIVDALLNNSEFGISTALMLNYSITGLFYFFGLLIFLLVVSFFNNPNLSFKIRTKLCLYDTLIFFVIMCFYIGFGSEWLLYLALGASTFYAMITFSHIIKK